MITKLLLELPPGHRIVLFELIKFLSKVASKSTMNKMDASNLSIVFGPNILIHKEMTVAMALQETPAVTGITETLITEFPQIFPPDFVPNVHNIEKTGLLLKKGKYGNKWRSRFVHLNGNRRLFVYYEDENHFNNPDQEPLGEINLSECIICPAMDRPYCFKIISPSRTYWFAAANQEDLEQWRDSVNNLSALQDAELSLVPGSQAAKLSRLNARGSWYIPKTGVTNINIPHELTTDPSSNLANHSSGSDDDILLSSDSRSNDRTKSKPRPSLSHREKRPSPLSEHRRKPSRPLRKRTLRKTPRKKRFLP